MSGMISAVFVLVACSLGCVSVALMVKLMFARRARFQRRAIALGSYGEHASLQTSWANRSNIVLRYAEQLSRLISTGALEPITPSVRAKRVEKTRAGKQYNQTAMMAGCAKNISVLAYCETLSRLTVMGALVGTVFGMLFSLELGLLFGVAAAILGRSLLPLVVRHLVRQRALGAELHLSEMLEVVALGLRSGMTFDRSFALYGSYFNNEFAHSCVKTYRLWSLGLQSREQALRDLAASYDCEQLSRVIDSIIRSLHFGTSLAGILEEASSQSRASYRAVLEEKVAKAPVKMMLPTGTLILPAMLLMVMGPIFLELASGL